MYAGLESTQAALGPQRGSLASSGRDLVRQGLSSSSGGAPDATLPPGWEEVTTPDGQPYYYNAALNKTQWEKPEPVVAAPAPAKAAPPPPVPAARPALAPRAVKLMATAVYAYKATQADELTIAEGDRLEILEKLDAHWWKCKKGMATGLVPATYCKEG